MTICGLLYVAITGEIIIPKVKTVINILNVTVPKNMKKEKSQSTNSKRMSNSAYVYEVLWSFEIIFIFMKEHASYARSDCDQPYFLSEYRGTLTPFSFCIRVQIHG